MDYDKFFQAMEDIYAIFGKKAPESRVIELVYRRVKNLPEGFMNYAVRHFEELETMPRNMGRYLLRELWPDYLDQHPELQDPWQSGSCPDCETSMPGWRRAYKPETLANGREVYVPIHVRCKCGYAPNPKNERIYQDYELKNFGILFDCPYEYDRDNPPEFLRKAMRADDSIRSEHLDCLDRYEYGEW